MASLSLLALEVPTSCRPACGFSRDPRSGPDNQPRQPALGCPTQSWRVADTRHRHRPVHCRQVHVTTSRAAVSGLAGLPAQSRRPHRRHRSVRLADRRVQTALRAGHPASERGQLVWTNVTANPTAEWIARQITDAFPWNEAPGYLIRDRDTAFGAAVTRRLRGMGIRDRPITPRSPWQNGHVERLIGSIRRECLDHVVVLGESHLRYLLANYSTYYNGVRTHLALDKDAPFHRPAQTIGRIASVSWLGGLHHQYVRTA